MQVDIANIVAVCDLGRLISGVEVSVSLSGRYDSAVFPAVVSSCMETGTSSQIFATGRTVHVGCPSEEHALHAALLIQRAAWDVLRLKVEVLNFDVVNIVARVECGFALNLDLLYQDVAEMPDTVLQNARGEGGPAYDPDRFTGISWGVRTPFTDARGRRVVITLALFDTGNGVATGQKQRVHLEWVRGYLQAHMPRYRRGQEYRACEAHRSRKRKTAPLARETKRVKA